MGSLLGHPGFDVVDLLRDAGGNPFGAVLGHEHVVLDTDADAAVTYGVRTLPTTYFINADGFLIAQGRTALDEETLQTGIDMILG